MTGTVIGAKNIKLNNGEEDNLDLRPAQESKNHTDLHLRRWKRDLEDFVPTADAQ